MNMDNSHKKIIAQMIQLVFALLAVMLYMTSHQILDMMVINYLLASLYVIINIVLLLVFIYVLQNIVITFVKYID
jgi:hypothetical protein